MNLTRLSSALAVVVGLLIAPVPIAGAANAQPMCATQAQPAQLATATAAAPAGDSVAVELAPAGSGVLVPGQDLVLNVTITNRTLDLVQPTTAKLYLAGSDIRDHVELGRWLAESTAAQQQPSGMLIAETPTPAVAAGDSVTLPQVIVPAAALPISVPTRFGVRELEMRLDVGGTITGARSTITFDPGPTPPAASVALVMPITVPNETVGLIPADQLAVLTAPLGLLTRELDQVRGRFIALAIDPRIILSIRALGSGAPASAVAYLADLSSLPNVTFPLAYADSDVAAVAQTGSKLLTPTPFTLDPNLFPPVTTPPPTQPPTQPPTPTASTPPSPSASPSASPQPNGAPTAPTLDELLAFNYTRTDIVWPREKSVVSGDFAQFESAGLTTAILPSTNVVFPAGDTTPSPVAQFAGHTALISDSPASAMFRDAVTATTTPQWESAVARLTGVLAAVASEGQTEGNPQLLVASLDRGSATDTVRLGATLDAISQYPWSSAAQLTTALAATPSAATLLDTPTPTAQVAAVQSMIDSENATNQFASVLADPTKLTGPRRLALLALTSQSWVGAGADWAPAVAGFLTRGGEIVSSVHIDTAGSITVLADNGNLPISVSNVLDFPVTVYVQVTSPRIILSVREPRVAVTIEAKSQKRVSIPVQSIANGEVTISIALTSATGVPIGTPTFAPVSVRAGWETAATTVLAVLVGLTFIAGIIRTIRRRRATLATNAALRADAKANPPANTDATLTGRTDG